MAVNIAAANSEILAIESSCDTINNYVKNIQENFSNGIQSIWNSPTAKNMVVKVDGAINQVINSTNKALFSNGGNSALEAVQSASDAIAKYNNGATISELTNKTIDRATSDWSGVEDGYNFPELGFDMTAFLEENVVSNLSSVIAELENIKSSMSNINNDIGGNYLDNAITSIGNSIDEINGETGIVAVQKSIKELAQQLDEDRKNMELKTN